MEHSKGFLALVERVRADVQEISFDKLALWPQESYLFFDVREDHEYVAGSLKGATHLGRGIIERDIEHSYPDKNQPIVLFCGGGYRSILAASNLQLMGYQQVYSVTGGYTQGIIQGWGD
jgi:rhodanese-related sulfurtransferase